MPSDHTSLEQGNNENSVSKRRTRAYVWDYFERVTGDDGSPKTRCTTCNKVYSTAPKSGTSTMRRHLRKCCPQPITQFNPMQSINTTRSNGEVSDEIRAAKKLKSIMMENLHSKTNRELVEFIWMNKRNVGILEQKLPEKARAIKEAIKCYEDEIGRRAKLLHPKENGPVKIEADDQHGAQCENIGEYMAEGANAVGGKITETHLNVNQHQTSPNIDNGKLDIKVEVGDQSMAGDENFVRNIAEEERAGRLQIIAINRDENQTTSHQTIISILPQDMCAELKKVSSVLSMLTSPNSSYTPQHNPLDQEAENAKQTLIQLLEKDFKTIVGTPDEQNVKHCIQILIKNLHKLPLCQGKVIETLNTEFESACRNWSTWRTSIQNNVAFKVQQGSNFEFLQEWQEKDTELESKIVDVDADIDRLKRELREKELTRENLVKQKSDLFDQSKISIDEAKKLLQEMVSVKLQSDVATDNMKELATKWEKIRDSFQVT